MYFTDGQNPNEIGDIDVVEHEGRLHVFHLCLPSHDQVGHLVSSDGLHWERLPPAIRTGDPSGFDDDQIWTMGVCRPRHPRFGGKWFMLYTALQRRGLVQVIGLATSTDLIRWTKHAQNPVAVPDPRWYEAHQSGHYRIDWRDPHIVEEDGRLHAFLCAREKDGALNHRGCAARLSSEDGERWEVHPPVCTPRNAYDFECPSVFKLGGRFYLTAIHGGHERQTYRVADRIEGPYRRPADDSVMPARNLAHRPCLWRGRQYLFHWTSGARDWGTRHPGYQALASPKLAHAEPDGSLRVESFDWSSEYAAASRSITPSSNGVAGAGRWGWRDGALIGNADYGTGAWLLPEGPSDFELTAELQLDAASPAREFGFVFRADDTGDRGMYARCIPGRGAVELVRQIYNRRNGPESLHRGRTVLQTFHMPPSADGRYRLRLIAYGPNLEFNANGRLVLAMLSMKERSGRAGVFVEDGGGAFTDLRLAILKAPTTNWDL